jgi:ectoine hydroxylase-related dioxygenase (phytanoyl-CoA dioxygenase family)
MSMGGELCAFLTLCCLTLLYARVQEMQAIGKAGSAFLFDARLWHGAPDHLSPEPRVGTTIRFM